jgi:hypothetical protein
MKPGPAFHFGNPWFEVQVEPQTPAPEKGEITDPDPKPNEGTQRARDTARREVKVKDVVVVGDAAENPAARQQAGRS